MTRDEAACYALAIQATDQLASYVRFYEYPAMGGWWVTVRYEAGRYTDLASVADCEAHLARVVRNWIEPL
jgi:hypothetical protein